MSELLTKKNSLTKEICEWTNSKKKDNSKKIKEKKWKREREYLVIKKLHRMSQRRNKQKIEEMSAKRWNELLKKKQNEQTNERKQEPKRN